LHRYVSSDDTCGDRNKATTEKIYEIAVFSMGSGGFSFNRDKHNFLKKEHVGELEICIAVRV
jgi:hypothetical protein